MIANKALRRAAFKLRSIAAGGLVVMFVKRSDIEQIVQLKEIVPLKLSNRPLRFKRRNWKNVTKR